MARYAKNSKLSTAAILKAAIGYFGTEGLGMILTEQAKKPTESSAMFKGTGHVFILARKTASGSEVQLETGLKDQQVSEFLEKL
jgi:hypothetical protein